MSCYHPLIASVDVDLDGKKHLHFLRGKYDPHILDRNVECTLQIPRAGGHLDVEYSKYLKIPCGKCLGCKFDYCRNWSDRMMLELVDNDMRAIFVTMTYDNDHVPIAYDDDDNPVSYTLCKRDLQLFFKRLRKRFCDCQIRFFACGEYGSKTLRPHYHAIIYGITINDFADLRMHGVNELMQPYYISAEFACVWSNGHCLISPVSYKTCAYVARYNVKKAYGDNIKPSEYALDSFVQMSRRPGIASRYYDNHPEFFETMSAFFADSNGSVRVNCPSYFLRKLSIDNPVMYANIVSERRQISRDRELLRLARSDLSYPEQLEIEENDLFRRTHSILFERSSLSDDAPSDK